MGWGVKSSSPYHITSPTTGTSHAARPTFACLQSLKRKAGTTSARSGRRSLQARLSPHDSKRQKSQRKQKSITLENNSWAALGVLGREVSILHVIISWPHVVTCGRARGSPRPPVVARGRPSLSKGRKSPRPATSKKRRRRRCKPTPPVRQARKSTKAPDWQSWSANSIDGAGQGSKTDC